MTRRNMKTPTGPAVSPMNPIIDNGAELQASLLVGIAKTSVHLMYSAENSGLRKAFVERLNRELTRTLNGGSVK